MRTALPLRLLYLTCLAAGQEMTGFDRERDRLMLRDVVVFYGALVTVADLVFADGTRLEGRRVIPDETVLPSGGDLAAHRDPALARAIVLAGRTITPETAGALFPLDQ